MENLPVQDAPSTFVISLADIDLKKKAWMDGKLFEQCLQELNRKFGMQGRKVVMKVDNCPAHPDVSGLKAINLQFLPPNITSCIQPTDQGVIRYVCFITFLFY